MTFERLPEGNGFAVTADLLPTADLGPDGPTQQIFASFTQQAGETVGSILTDLRMDEYAQETPLGNLTVDLMRAHAGSDLALLRCATVNNTFPGGPIRERQLEKMNGCGMDEVARVTLTGKELRTVLEYGATEAYYLLTISGARVGYDGDRPVGHRVVSVQVEDEPLNPERRYTVVCSEILALGAAGFTPLKGKPYKLLGVTVNALLMAHIKLHESIRPAVDGRLIIRGPLPRHPDFPPAQCVAAVRSLSCGSTNWIRSPALTFGHIQPIYKYELHKNYIFARFEA